VDEAEQCTPIERRTRGLDAISAQLGIANGVTKRELDVESDERAPTCRESLEQAIDRGLEEEYETFDILLVVIEDDAFVGCFGRRERHERIPALAGRELI
jgi:hypothetical protein